MNQNHSGKGNTFSGDMMHQSHIGGNNNFSGERGGSVIRKGSEKRRRDGDSGVSNRLLGSIMNTTRSNIRFPSGLKQKYFSHFVNTFKMCGLGSKCKHKHKYFLVDTTTMTSSKCWLT